MRLAVFAFAAALALPALPALAYENFIPLGHEYTPDEKGLPPLGSEKDQKNAQVDVYETEVYNRQLRLKRFDNRLYQLLGQQEPGHIDDEHIDY